MVSRKKMYSLKTFDDHNIFQIINLKSSDSGNYTCQIETMEGSTIATKYTLTVIGEFILFKKIILTLNHCNEMV